jgi:hypothetical protein
MAKSKSKTYTIVTKVPGVFGDDKFRVFHNVGSVVSDNDPDVKRAVELYPDHFSEA